MNGPTEIRVMFEPWYAGYSVMIRQGDAIATSMTMEKMEEGQLMGPTTRLDRKEVQLLMDDLWHCGVRPSEGTGSTGQLKATENHLKDMRQLVFNKEKTLKEIPK